MRRLLVICGTLIILAVVGYMGLEETLAYRQHADICDRANQRTIVTMQMHTPRPPVPENC